MSYIINLYMGLIKTWLFENNNCLGPFGIWTGGLNKSGGIADNKIDQQIFQQQSTIKQLN